MAIPDYRESESLGQLLRQYPSIGPRCVRCRNFKSSSVHRPYEDCRTLSGCDTPEAHHTFLPEDEGRCVHCDGSLGVGDLEHCKDCGE